jgi:hypothetical protein
MIINLYIVKLMNYTQQHMILFLLLIIICPSIVFSEDVANETSIVDDVYTALTLQGIDCDGIEEMEQSEEGGYDVVCESGGEFNISQTKNGVLAIADQITGAVFKGIGIFINAIPMTGQIFQQSDKLSMHDAEVARSLFSIIELSGNTCDSIVKVVSHNNDGHIVSCETNLKYHVYTHEDGLVAVEAILE